MWESYSHTVVLAVAIAAAAAAPATATAFLSHKHGLVALLARMACPLAPYPPELSPGRLAPKNARSGAGQDELVAS